MADDVRRKARVLTTAKGQSNEASSLSVWSRLSTQLANTPEPGATPALAQARSACAIVALPLLASVDPAHDDSADTASVRRAKRYISQLLTTPH